jgi:hypothetical protein
MAYVNEFMATGAGLKQRFALQGRYFRIVSMSSGVPSLDIEFLKDRKSVESGFVNCGPGFAYHAPGGFDEIVIANHVTQQVAFLVTDNETTYGDVTVLQGVAELSARSAPMSAAVQVLVGTADQEIAAARAGRRFILVQNKSATATLWLNLAGNAATQANSLKIPPGGYWESSAAFCPSNAIRGISDAAGCDVHVVEGV